jgi:LTXXQ motif family protein
MNPTRVRIILCTLLVVAVQLADAEQSSQHFRRPRSSTNGGLDVLATDVIVTDPLLLPLLGMSDHIDGHLAFIKTELKITQAQLPLWNSFAAAARANATQENEMLEQESSSLNASDTTPSLPQRLAAHEKDLTAHLKMLQRITAALLPLYASFSDEQKRSAEALVNGPAGL